MNKEEVIKVAMEQKDMVVKDMSSLLGNDHFTNDKVYQAVVDRFNIVINMIKLL